MTLLESLTVVSLALGIIAMLGKFLIVNPLKAYIKDQTHPIQPTANGGRSLPDVARAVDRIEKRLDEHITLHLKDEL
jgi:hypothetical protein